MDDTDEKEKWISLVSGQQWEQNNNINTNYAINKTGMIPCTAFFTSLKARSKNLTTASERICQNQPNAKDNNFFHN